MIATVASATCAYLIPKGLTYLCTQIEQPISRIDQIRCRCFAIQQTVQRALGPRTWLFLTDLLADNAWISVLVLSAAAKGKILAIILQQPLNAVLLFVYSASAAMMMRHVMARRFPALIPLIGLRGMAPQVNLEQLAMQQRELLRPCYQYLLQFLENHLDRFPRTAEGNWNFRDFTEIPDPLRDDQVLSYFTCRLTMLPILHPVMIAGQQNVYYERSAIEAWIQSAQAFPVTEQPLSRDQVIEVPAVQAVIDHRLRFHQNRLESFMNEENR